MVRPRPSQKAAISTDTRDTHARTYLGSRSVINLGKVNPSLGLEVLRVVYLSAFAIPATKIAYQSQQEG